MKYLFITLSILLLSSCTQYRYDVTYEKCNGQTGSVSYTGAFPVMGPQYSDITYKLNFKSYPFSVTEVCDFYYTRNPIK